MVIWIISTKFKYENDTSLGLYCMVIYTWAFWSYFIVNIKKRNTLPKMFVWIPNNNITLWYVLLLNYIIMTPGRYHAQVCVLFYLRTWVLNAKILNQRIYICSNHSQNVTHVMTILTKVTLTVHSSYYKNVKWNFKTFLVHMTLYNLWTYLFCIIINNLNTARSRKM
jgi:hypothetical protein